MGGANKASKDIVELRNAPAIHALSRRVLPTLDRNKYAPASGVAQGAYVLADALGGNPEVILIASGSELILAVEAHEKLIAEGIRSRVVSIRSWEIFKGQTRKYQKSVLPPGLTARIAIEEASISGRERYVGASTRIIKVESFPAPAPLKAHQKSFAYEPDRIASAAKELLGR
jgi:transketolase